MRNNKISLLRKLEVLQFAEISGNLWNNARKFKIQPSQIRQWRKIIEEIKLKAENSPGKLTLNNGPKLENQELEDIVYFWVLS